MSTISKNPMDMFGYLANGSHLKCHLDVAKRLGISSEALFEMCEKNIGMSPMPVLVQGYYWFYSSGFLDTWKLRAKKADDSEIEAAAEIILRHNQAKHIPNALYWTEGKPRESLLTLFSRKRV